MYDVVISLLGPILYFVLLVVAVLVLYFTAFWILYAIPRGIYESYCWRRSLKIAGRYKTQLYHAESIRTGTLIIDSPALGWNVKHCWWTPLDLKSISPEPIPTANDRDSHLRGEHEELEMPFDRWVYKNLLDIKSGTATLLCVRRGDLLAKRIQRMANIPVVESWSGPIRLRESNMDAGG